jgi:hypothetical protein
MDPLLPKKEGTCDKCGDKLIIRSDDTEAVNIINIYIFLIYYKNHILNFIH